MLRNFSKKTWQWLCSGISLKFPSASSNPFKQHMRPILGLNCYLQHFSTLEEKNQDSSHLNSLLKDGEDCVKDNNYIKSFAIYSKALDIAYKEYGKES
jgi:hypothetical protein